MKRKICFSLFCLSAAVCMAAVLISASPAAGIAEASGHPAQAFSVAADEAAIVSFSLEAGADIRRKTVELHAPAGFDIYYTTDGSDPTPASQKYTKPLVLKPGSSRLAAESDSFSVGGYRINDHRSLPRGVTLKALATDADGTTTPVATRTYFFQPREPVIVLSISTDYRNLLDYHTGIMVKGAYYDEWRQSPKAQAVIDKGKEPWRIRGNFTQKGKAWERPAAIEIFDAREDGTQVYILEHCGIRIRGGASRMFAQKKL